jgi:hypothetical protein
MLKTTTIIVAWSGALAASVLAADASGSWAVSSSLVPPDLTCEFALKDSTLSGSCSAVKVRLPITDGTATDRAVRWTINVPADTGIGTAYIFSGDLNEEGTAMTGTLILANGNIGIDKGTFTAKKQ